MPQPRSNERQTPPAGVGTDRMEHLLAGFEQMCRIRAFEEEVARAYEDKVLPGLLHLSIGSEAAAVGVIGGLTSADRVYSSHRPHGHFLAAGVSMEALFAELAGRSTGLCGGFGGSMHLMDDRAVMATGIVGGTLPIALGHSLALPAEAVAVAFFGDGAVQTGIFHETLNLAALWDAPVLFACENNGWAEFTAREEHTRVGSVAAYGDLYGMRSLSVDGSDLEAIESAAAELVGGARRGAGPAILEMHVSRLRPHYEGDLRRAARGRDPVEALSRRLVELGQTEAHLDAIIARQRAEARAALARALQAPLASDPDRHVFAGAFP